MTAEHAKRPLVEILYFDGCPNHTDARLLVELVAEELRLEPEIRMVEVPDRDAATRLRFLGSPSVRVNGSDVEPGGDDRGEFVLSCRVYRSDRGFAGQPDEAWIRAALREAVGGRA